MINFGQYQNLCFHVTALSLICKDFNCRLNCVDKKLFSSYLTYFKNVFVIFSQALKCGNLIVVAHTVELHWLEHLWDHEN